MITNNTTAPSKYPFIISMHLHAPSRAIHILFLNSTTHAKNVSFSSTCPLVNVSNTSAVIYDGSPQSSLFPLP